MHYPDLKSYYMYDDTFPNMINVGWIRLLHTQKER